MRVFYFQKCRSCPHLLFAKWLESKLDWSSMFFYKYIRLWRLFIIILPKERRLFEANTSKQLRHVLKSLKMKMKVTQLCPILCDPHLLYGPWDSPGQNTGVGSLSLLQGIFPTQGSNPGLPHSRWILYQLSHKGSPRILEWVAYPFSSRSSQPRNRTRVSCIAGRFFTSWAMREAHSFSEIIEFNSQLFKSKH